jgi:cold shock CspA family protein
MAQGAVKWFHSALGCGAIVPDDGSPVVLVDSEVVQAAGISPPRKGDRLEYEPVRGASGRLWATNLQAAPGEARQRL